MTIWERLKKVPKTVWVFLAGAFTAAVVYLKFRQGKSKEGAPDPNIDRIGVEGWKKADTDSKKPQVENPLAEEEIDAGEKHIRGLD